MTASKKIKLSAIVSLILSGLFFLLVTFTSIPLGISGDWVWTRGAEYPVFPVYELIALVLFPALALACAASLVILLASPFTAVFHAFIFAKRLFCFSFSKAFEQNLFSLYFEFNRGNNAALSHAFHSEADSDILRKP